jgi:PAS domain S-box-containing protein
MIQVTDTTEQVRARQQLALFNQTLVLSGLYQHELTEVAEAGIQDLQRSLRETDHRARNNLQIIGALLDMQVMGNSEAVSIADLVQLQQSIQTLAALHGLLTQTVHDGATAGTLSIAGMLKQLLPMWQKLVGAKHLRWSAEDLELPVKKAMSLALLINELITNAAKHGGREVDLRLALQGDRATLTVSDDGPGFPPGFDPAASAHFGLEFVASVVRAELEGKVTFASSPGGGGCVEVTFPGPSSSSPSQDIASVPFASVFAPSLLQETMRSFAAFANTLQDHAVILMDGQANILRWSLGAERLFGYSVQEMLGKPLAVLFTPDDVRSGAVTGEMAQAIREGRAPDDRWLLRKDGSRFLASGVLTALTDTHVGGFVKILRDVTVQEEARDRQAQSDAQVAVLREHDHMAQHLQDTLSQGFAGIAHALELAQRALADPPEDAQAVQGCITQALHLAQQSLGRLRHPQTDAVSRQDARD